MQSAESRAREQWELYLSDDTVFRIGNSVARPKPNPSELIPDEVQNEAGAFKYTLADKSRQFIYMRSRKEWREITKSETDEVKPDHDRSRQWPSLCAQFPDVTPNELVMDAKQFRDGSWRYTSNKTGKHYRYNFLFSRWQEL